MAMIAAATAPIFVAAAGGAVDYARYAEVRQVSEKALDSASIGVATAISRGQLDPEDKAAHEAYGKELFSLNINDNSVGNNVTPVNFSVEYNPVTFSVTANVDVAVPTIFAGLIGIPSFDASIASTSGFGGTPGDNGEGGLNKVEFSFVLDLTGSMKGERLDALKVALRDSLNVLLPAGADGEPGRNDDRVRVGFVPYSVSVNLGNDFHEKAVGANTASANSNNTCVTEREGVNAFSPVAPTSSLTNTLYETDSDLRTFSSDACPDVAIRPLTNDRGALLGDIEAFSASGATGGHMGIDWGVNLLLDEWQDFWPDNSKPADNDAKGVRKVLVVMTDGEFNTSYYNNNTIQAFSLPNSGSNSTRRARRSNVAALKFCDLAKSENSNIEVYTIAFDAGSSAEALLKACATPDPEGTEEGEGHFFDAASGEELAAAFQSIVGRELPVLLLN